MEPREILHTTFKTESHYIRGSTVPAFQMETWPVDRFQQLNWIHEKLIQLYVDD